MHNEESGQHDLVHVGWQVVMEEESPVVEEEGKEVEEIASEQDLPHADKLLPEFWKKYC